jgi:hypothetical protein
MLMVDENDNKMMKAAWNESRDLYQRAAEDFARGKDQDRNILRGASATQGKNVSAEAIG